MTQAQWIKHAVFHPLEGFSDLRWKKAGSVSAAWIILALWFAGEVLLGTFSGKQFVMTDADEFSVIPYIIKTAVIFLVWTAANHAVCTLLDGEGSRKRIFIYSAYSLVPYVVQVYVHLILSHILIREEEVFIIIAEVTGVLWSALLLFNAVKTAHQFSLSRTVGAVLLTIAAGAFILVLLVLSVSLIQQVYSFIAAIFTELEYRSFVGGGAVLP